MGVNEELKNLFYELVIGKKVPETMTFKSFCDYIKIGVIKIENGNVILNNSNSTWK